jgi:hypothetical protein
VDRLLRLPAIIEPSNRGERKTGRVRCREGIVAINDRTDGLEQFPVPEDRQAKSKPTTPAERQIQQRLLRSAIKRRGDNA